MNKTAYDADWWAERASQGLVHWRLSDDERWYIGESANNSVRFLSLDGFTPLTEFVVEVLSPENVWEPLHDLQTTSKLQTKAFLFRAARYTLIVRHDLGPPDNEELFDAFLAYRSDEAELAERVAVALQSEGIHIWYDKWNIPSQRVMPLERYIRYGLKRSSTILRLWIEYPSPLMSHAMLNEDRWVWYELGIALMFTPMTLQRELPEELDSNFDRRILELAKLLRGSINYEEIASRVWHDEDPYLYVWDTA